LRAEPIRAPRTVVDAEGSTQRAVYFHGIGYLGTRILDLHSLQVEEELHGPAIVQTPVTTIVIDPGARARRTESASLVIETGASGPDLRELEELNLMGRSL
jgi:N-methylhydantoinase A